MFFHLDRCSIDIKIFLKSNCYLYEIKFIWKDHALLCRLIYWEYELILGIEIFKLEIQFNTLNLSAHRVIFEMNVVLSRGF